MADEYKFEIPDAEKTKEKAQKALEAELHEVSERVKSALEEAIANKQWPAKIPTSAIPEKYRSALYEQLKDKKYSVVRGDDYWEIKKPE